MCTRRRFPRRRRSKRRPLKLIYQRKGEREKLAFSISCDRRNGLRRRSATYPVETFEVRSERGVTREHLHCRVQDLAGVRVFRLDKAVMHPFAVTASLYQAGTFQIGKVTRNLWVIGLERVGEKARANLAVSQEIQEPKARAVGQRGEKEFGIKACHDKNIIT